AVRRLLFILSCPADPRDLHSFPTRRSSDLAGQRARLGGRLLALRNQPARNRTGVESPAVVFDDDAEAALVEGCNDLHRALLGLAARDPLLRALDAMVDRIAHEMEQWLPQRVDHDAVDLHVLALDHEPRLLSRCGRDVAHRA